MQIRRLPACVGERKSEEFAKSLKKCVIFFQMTKLLAVLVEEKKSLNFNIYMTVKLSRNPRDSCYNITYGGRRAEIWRRGENGICREERKDACIRASQEKGERERKSEKGSLPWQVDLAGRGMPRKKKERRFFLHLFLSQICQPKKGKRVSPS